MGKYARYPFLKLINVIDQADKGMDLRFEIKKSKLMRVPHKLIASGIETTRADVFVFETHPAKLLNIAEVFRRELMPIVAFSNEEHYQRRLDFKKLQQMQLLVTKSDFMFPGSILVALSEKCEYIRNQGKLVIPEIYGSISVIDGQHRLFAYANRVLPDKVREDANILVTALLFETKTPEQVLHCSAKTFIEINSKQKRISSDHIIEIAYKALGDQGPKALAAQVILDCNQRKGKALYGMFSPSQTSKGRYKVPTVIVHLARLTNLDSIKRLVKADTKEKAKAKHSYEVLFDRPIQELQDAEVLIKQSVVCLEHFFSYVKRIFQQDWIDCQNSENSMTMHKTTLAYTKVFCGFIILLREFIKDGLDWSKIEQELKTIRSNILKRRGLLPDDPGIALAIGASEIPDDRYPPSDTFRFLNKNRRQPTSIQEIS